MARRRNKDRWTIVAGREIQFDGEPVIRVSREGDTEPVVADGAANLIVQMFNQSGVTPDSIYEEHMGYPKGGPYPWDPSSKRKKRKSKRNALKRRVMR